MRTLFVGDVHGCPVALTALLRAARPDQVVLLGDIFAKGPDPRGVWDIVRDIRPRAVMGNHDHKLLRIWSRVTPDRAGESVHHAAVAALDEEAHAWIEALPLFLEGDGWTAVHAGVHPERGVAGTTPDMAMVLRRWPHDGDRDNPFWWELYRSSPRIIYGHDAMRGLQNHRHSLGLDTGCVYGGLLTGYVLEEDEIVQVEGRR